MALTWSKGDPLQIEWKRGTPNGLVDLLFIPINLQQ